MFKKLVIPILLFVFILPLYSSSKCYAKVGLNITCLTNDDCLSGLYCDYYLKKCLQYPHKGQACGNQVYCGSGLGCFSNNTCQTLSLKGEQCMLGEFGYNICSTGLGCYSTITINECDVLKTTIGVPCTTDNKCGGGLGCNFDNNGTTYCIQKKAASGSCNNNDVCLNGYCDFSQLKCANKKGIGEVCVIGQCQDGLSCVPTKYLIFLTRMTCQTIPNSVGAVCSDVCGNGLVCRT